MSESLGGGPGGDEVPIQPPPGSAAARGDDRPIRDQLGVVSNRQMEYYNRRISQRMRGQLDRLVTGPRPRRFEVRTRQRYYGNLDLLTSDARTTSVRYRNMTLGTAIATLTEPPADYAPTLREALPPGSWLLIKSMPAPYYQRKVSTISWQLIIGGS